jgi:hypothetical protein
MLTVFRYITGADIAVTLCRFALYLKEGQEGMSLSGLTACLKEEGYTLAPCEEVAVIARRSDGANDRPHLRSLGRHLRGRRSCFMAGTVKCSTLFWFAQGGLCLTRALILRKTANLLFTTLTGSRW